MQISKEEVKKGKKELEMLLNGKIETIGYIPYKRYTTLNYKGLEQLFEENRVFWLPQISTEVIWLIPKGK